MASPSVPKGIRLNHTGLRVANIQSSIDFYTKAFGMKELGRVVSDTVTVGILGYEDAEDSSLPILSRQGILELVCSKVTPQKLTPQSKPQSAQLRG